MDTYDVDDPIAELERLDRFFDGEEEGERPLELFRARGMMIPEESSLDDGALHEKLWELIGEMATLGLFLDSTDHLSDRELYRYLITDALVEETILPASSASSWHISPIGGGSEEDNEIYIRYYADDETRDSWQREGDVLPPKETLPFDRDRLLPDARSRYDSDPRRVV